MAVLASDIGFYLSGGPFNHAPTKSVGGERSNAPVLAGIGGLFTDVTKQQAQSGLTDYRCIYVVNNNHRDTLYNTEVAIVTQTKGGAVCMAGVKRSTEMQRICMSTQGTKGTITLRYGHETCDVKWSPHSAETAERIANALNTERLGLAGVIVLAQGDGPNYVFTLKFMGLDDHKSHGLVEMVSTSLNADSQQSTVRESHGSPINAVAFQVSDGSIEPEGVTWVNTSEEAKISVGILQPGDSFPLWIRRSVFRDTAPLQEDGITVKITGQP